MIIVQNKLIPFKGYKAITLWPFVFTRKSREEYMKLHSLVNHEEIHGRQLLELLIIFFYLIYLIELIFKGYDNVSFEKEASANENNLDYLKTRKWFAMWRK